MRVELYSAMLGFAYVVGGGAVADGVFAALAIYGLRWAFAAIYPEARE